MLSFLDEWKAIDARIENLKNTLNNFLKIGEILLNDPIWRNESKDKHGIFAKFIVSEFQDIMKSIKAWNSKYPLLPVDIKQSVEDFTSFKYGEKTLEILVGAYSSSGSFLVGCQAIIPLFSFRGKINYLLSDSEFKIRHLTELAFIHLKRSIIADPDIRKKWGDAQNEVACEKLGALHLLSHSIWAFKAGAVGGKTDLICQEPLNKYFVDINCSALGLVLTEWKVVSDNKELVQKAEEARKQLQLYSSGVLSGIELKNTRYAVLVTKKEPNNTPEDFTSENGINYRHIIIATDPDTPSIQARKRETIGGENSLYTESASQEISVKNLVSILLYLLDF